MDNINPLLKYARRPEVYVPLPSQGYFNEPGDVELSEDGEVGIAPMTTNDELLLKTPDGLLNGESLIRVLQSCCPGLKNIREIPSPDLDVLLMGIRQASYGDEMEFQVVCPECEHEGTYVFSISAATHNIKKLDPEYYVKLDNQVTVFIKPYTIDSAIKDAMNRFKEAQAIKNLADDRLNENLEAQRQISEKIHGIADTIMHLTANSIIKILDPQGQEISADSQQIFEWLKSLPRKDATKITGLLNDINKAVIDKHQEIECTQCQHQWSTNINFDPTYFFGISS